MSKPIIIDGCNVEECYFFYKGECRCELNCIDLYKNETIIELAKRTPEHNYMECKPSDNCYFKQLQRLKEKIIKLTEENGNLIINRNTVENKLRDTENRLISIQKANTHNLVLLQRRNKALEEVREITKKYYLSDKKLLATGIEINPYGAIIEIQDKINEVLGD